MHPFCNLQRRARAHAVLVIGLHELLCNPTTYSLSHPGPLQQISVFFEVRIHAMFSPLIFEPKHSSLNSTNDATNKMLEYIL